MNPSRRIAVIGLGYVGLPVAVAFAKVAPVIGYDIDERRVRELADGQDRTGEVSRDELRASSAKWTADKAYLQSADFFIVTVPTPISQDLRPDLTALLGASEIVGKALKKGDIVVYESTVYPGATEEDCMPVLERESGLKGGKDFSVGYSPERINPGDREHRFETIAKVVSGQDEATLDTVADVYGLAVRAKIHKAPSIKVAEAAKVIENTQRDLNIALMNELSALFAKLDIDTHDVLAAAGTKWNFLPFKPGLVGGHCIGVDPYYLTHRAQRAGFEPEVILAGRRTNDSYGARVARECGRLLSGLDGKRVVVLGLTFKENVPDIRNSKVFDIVQEMKKLGAAVDVCDPLASPEMAQHEYGIDLTDQSALKPADAVVLAVSHNDFVKKGWDLATSLLANGRGVVMDVKASLDRQAKPDGITLWRP